MVLLDAKELTSIFLDAMSYNRMNDTIDFYKYTRLPVTRWVKLSLNFESQSRVYSFEYY